MFSTHEYVMAAEVAYRREQLIASLPARRARRVRTTRIASRILGRTAAPAHASPAQAAPAAQPAQGAGVACAA